jgi:ubiquinone/menaquinone biosynthesis C-methylase UbiE
MTDHFINIYTNRADDYHRFIAVEDVDGSLLKAIESVTPLAGKRLLDLGTGTGRLPLLLHQRVAHVTAMDLHRGMLREHTRQRDQVGGQWPLIQGDIRRLPLTAGCVDFVTVAWAMGHFPNWYAADWEFQLALALADMCRVIASPGHIIIFETLTTGSLTPAPPAPHLAAYYARLESEHGFTRHTLSTDYQFDSVEQAVAYTEFFFGPQLSEKIRANGWARLPEWTGMWVKEV